MFHRWGAFVAHHPRRVAAGALALLLIAIITMVTIKPDFSSEGFLSDNDESIVVARQLESQFGRSGMTLIFLFDADGPVTEGTVMDDVAASLASIENEPGVQQTLTADTLRNPAMISTDGTSTYGIVMLDPDIEYSFDQIDHMQESVEAAAAERGLEVSTGGFPVVNRDISHASEEGVIRAEIFAVPFTLIVLTLIFGGLVATGVPLVIGGLAIVTALATMTWLSSQGFQSIFAANVVTMLGLGLGIDYSLFMVTRFREELQKRPVDEAIAATMGTVGKAIVFSGITVMIGLGATQFFDLQVLKSLGQAGIIVTLATLIYGMTLLPAILALLGHRINAIAIGRKSGVDDRGESSFWKRVAHGVMLRPVMVMLACLVLLLAFASPIRHLTLTPGGVDMMPADSDVGVFYSRLYDEFPSEDASPVEILVNMDNLSPVSPEGVALTRSVVDQIQAMPGVDIVHSYVDTSGAPQFSWDRWSGSPNQLPQAVRVNVLTLVRDNTALISVVTDLDAEGEEDLVRDIRALNVEAANVQVGGFSAQSVDTLDAISDGMVPAVLFVLIAGYLILLLTFGSVWLPVKAMLMCLLSIGASLGVVVWVFQEGHLEDIFRFQATGEIVAIVPILIACILFGLSMDYEVLLLSRIQEEYDQHGDNTEAVAAGLAHTGQVVTGAAVIMVIVFGGFILADIAIIKSMGFGLALAVLLDATIVRGLLVPATMRLMGRWNWWAPAPIRTLVKRLGLSHADNIDATRSISQHEPVVSSR